MRKVELLAPVGTKENLHAAILAGCDAVYLGGYMFGARSYAGNFSNEELIDAIKYAHKYGVKVYVTTNTLIYENEVEMFLNYVEFLHKNNVDAIIVQDIGMFDLVRKTFPNLEIHISTQMHIHNLEGAKLVEKLGAKRVVLARETPIETIKEIKDKTNMDIEIFVHGALCISYSGQCLMSSLIGNRSGNRGSCAGSCRQKYNLIHNNERINKNEYLLSTKDLNTIEHVKELIDAGIDSFKIEGRMKSPAYVYLVVRLYREAIDSYLKTGKSNINEETLNKLTKTFNREFTKGFIFHDENNNIVNQYRPNHQGIKIGKVLSYKHNIATIKLTDTISNGDGIRILNEKEDVGTTVTFMKKDKKQVPTASKGDIITIEIKGYIKENDIVVKTTDFNLVKEIDNILKNDKRLVSINGIIDVELDKEIKLTITDGINEVTKYTNLKTSKPINSPITKDKIYEQISKLGNTIYTFEKLDINCNEDIFIPIKELNELKRSAIEELDLLRDYKINFIKDNYSIEVPNFQSERNLNIFIEEDYMYNSIKDLNINKIYTENKELLPIDNRLVLKLPRVINNFIDYENNLLVGEMGSINKYNNIETDFSLNVTNSYSVALLHNLGVNKVTLSYELDNKQTKDIIDSYHKRYNKHPNLEVITYAHEEVMITKYNLLKHYNLKDKAYLEDRFNNLYPIKVKDNLMYIYNFNKRNNEDIEYLYSIGINNIRYNLLNNEDLINFTKISKKS